MSQQGLIILERAVANGASSQDLAKLQIEADCLQYFISELPKRLPPEKIVKWDDEVLRLWETIAGYLMECHRFHEALALLGSLYEHLHRGQKVQQRRIHKGNALLWMTECFFGMGYLSMARRYMMLTLCEDAINFHQDHNTPINPKTSGLYPRAVWIFGLSGAEVDDYAAKAVRLYESDSSMGLFPEWILQGLGNDWTTVPPSASESAYYVLNKLYVETLAGKHDPTGKTWEMVCSYIVSCIPGCMTERRVRANAGEYDVVCSMSGPDLDFRSELGRYFVCECKDRQDPSTFTEMAKFCRILDATKSRFGILFSREGITGEQHRKEAKLEQERVYWDRGIVVVCIDGEDINDLARGGNFIRMLKRRVEDVRLSRANPSS